MEQLSALPIDGYCAVFSPLNELGDDSGPVMISLRDALADIYLDLERGFRHFDSGHTQSALWSWNQSFDSHWSRHLSHAQSALAEFVTFGESRVPTQPPENGKPHVL